MLRQAQQPTYKQTMNKILIMGNSGSGKSWLSSHIARIMGIREVNLDALVWEPGGFNSRRPQAIINAEIQALAKASSWVVEGVFGRLLEMLIPTADTLLFLDLDGSVCRDSLLSRGSQSAKQHDPEAAEENFQKLLLWAGEYHLRTGQSSRLFHNKLFEGFCGNRVRFVTRAQVNLYIHQQAEAQGGK